MKKFTHIKLELFSFIFGFEWCMDTFIFGPENANNSFELFVSNHTTFRPNYVSFYTIYKNQIIKTYILSALKIWLKQNYFQAENLSYVCSERLIMGNPRSSLVAEIFMEEIIKIYSLTKSYIGTNIYMIKEKSLPDFHIRDIWVWYVGSFRKLDKCFYSIKIIHPKNKFPMELEDNTINSSQYYS